MDNTLKDLYDEARQLFDAGNYAKAEGKCREVIRLAKQRGDDVTLSHGYMLLATCLDRLNKVITMHDSREETLTHFFPFFLAARRGSGCVRRGSTFFPAGIWRRFRIDWRASLLPSRGAL